MKPYPKYRDSGVEWIGEIPADWSNSTIRWNFKVCSGGTPDKTKLEYWEDGIVPWISSGEVNQGIIKFPSTFISNSLLILIRQS